MKKMKLMILLLAVIGMFTACENDKFYFQDDARVRIEGPYEWAVGTDSLTFSFAAYPSQVQEQGMEMKLYVMGEAAATDRTAKLAIDRTLTTANDDQYVFPETVTIPAGKLEAPFIVTLKRADLTSGTVSLYFRVVETNDFKVGVIEQNHFCIKWNDTLSKPKNWDTELLEFFGEYSLVKYRFIIDTIGFGEFSATSMSWSELTNYKIIMKTALDEYNDAHPGEPLKDENGLLVTF
ncbi:MAG: DUF4843 domain-containing protein [Bacteroidaceae bacterium]|nr:DUF4843 domain-containing protein [Bacteroidaceae bacterium]